jgi:hypothetical protein
MDMSNTYEGCLTTLDFTRFSRSAPNNVTIRRFAGLQALLYSYGNFRDVVYGSAGRKQVL